MEEVIETMRRNITVVRRDSDGTYSILYAGSDPDKSRAVLDRLMTSMRNHIDGDNRARAVQWEVWQRRVGATDRPPALQAAQWTLLGPPQTGVAGARPWPPYTIAGLLAGAVLGLLLFALLRRTRWTVTALACTAARMSARAGSVVDGAGIVPLFDGDAARRRAARPFALGTEANPPALDERVSSERHPGSVWRATRAVRHNITFRMLDRHRQEPSRWSYEDHDPGAAQAGVQELARRIARSRHRRRTPAASSRRVTTFA